VSNIPGLDDAVGKKTVDEAIENYYGDSKPVTQAPVETTPKVDEPIVLADESESVTKVTPTTIPLQITSQPENEDSGDIVITLDDEEEDNSSGFGFAGWMRGRR
jgi:hypothetical protein